MARPMRRVPVGDVDHDDVGARLEQFRRAFEVVICIDLHRLVAVQIVASRRGAAPA
jgi:hypothetical protein